MSSFNIGDEVIIRNTIRTAIVKDIDLPHKSLSGYNIEERVQIEWSFYDNSSVTEWMHASDLISLIPTSRK